ncbi:MAG TPA: DUF5668 domain-containing protein [Candidatus Eisenbacteria bacterium]|nr:DUF5668 domain-containing protein [Candidatus Eisenbacteria bacterium]
MSFGRLLFGAILVGLGGVLLASQLGYLPQGVVPWFLQFWPALIILIGIALLANAMKNLLLGWLAAILALGAIGLGAWWLAHNKAEAGGSHVARIDLERPRVEALTIRTRTLGGKVVLASAGAADAGKPVSGKAAAGRALSAVWKGVSQKDAEYRWSASGGAGLFEWPKRTLIPNTAPFGGSLDLAAPRRIPIRLKSECYLSGAEIDLSDLRPETCEIGLMSGAARMIVGDGAPSKITIRGFGGAAEIRLPAEGPVRVEFHSPFTARSLPDDFVEQVGGRGKARIWVAEGKGTPLLVVVDGALLYVKFKRAPQRAG